jgi:hypothetical protein
MTTPRAVSVTFAFVIGAGLAATAPTFADLARDALQSPTTPVMAPFEDGRVLDAASLNNNFAHVADAIAALEEQVDTLQADNARYRECWTSTPVYVAPGGALPATNRLVFSSDTNTLGASEPRGDVEVACPAGSQMISGGCLHYTPEGSANQAFTIDENRMEIGPENRWTDLWSCGGSKSAAVASAVTAYVYCIPDACLP